jgi:hypothetical protein
MRKKCPTTVVERQPPDGLGVSALGYKRIHMQSALAPKADTCSGLADVC